MTGWPMVPLRLARYGRLLLLGVWLCAAVAQAAPESIPPVDETETNFLQFLGFWHSEDGHWMDPFGASGDLLSRTLPGSKAEKLDPGERARRQLKSVESS